MAYTTTLQVARITGLGVEVQAELVGVGDGSSGSFDLENGNVIASSYTVEYADPDSNDLSSLTETTDYTLDLDKGALLLTASGKSSTNGKNIYISYTHCPPLSNTLLETYIDSADDEVDDQTGTVWDGPVSNTEYFDGELSHTYPRTDRPYARDYNEPDSVKLKRRNVTEITAAYFLKRGVQVSSVQSYDDNAATYTDNTDEAQTPAGTGFSFATTTAANDLIYIGATNKFLGIQIRLFTAGVTATNNTIEYWNGTAWTAFTPTSSGYQSIIDLESSGDLEWSDLSGWSKTTVNSSSSLYFIRIKAGGTYSTEPSISYIGLDQNLTIDKQIPLSRIDWTEDGDVTFLQDRFKNGVRNIRIDYKYGKFTTPEMIKELSALYVGLRAYANITGGSFDAATSYNIGRKSVTIGEQYVNVREVVRQFEVRIDALIRRVGRNYAVAVA